MTTDKIMALANTYAASNGKALLEKLYGTSQSYTEQCAAEAFKDRQALHTEIEKLVRENEAAHAVGIRQEQQIMDLEAESSALVRDAERWRTFLGTRPANTHDVICEAIDAAMEKQS